VTKLGPSLGTTLGSEPRDWILDHTSVAGVCLAVGWLIRLEWALFTLARIEKSGQCQRSPPEPRIRGSDSCTYAFCAPHTAHWVRRELWVAGCAPTTKRLPSNLEGWICVGWGDLGIMGKTQPPPQHLPKKCLLSRCGERARCTRVAGTMRLSTRRAADNAPRGWNSSMSPPSAAHRAHSTMSTMSLLVSMAWFSFIVINAPDLYREPAAKAAHSSWWADSKKAYEKYHCLTRRSGTRCSSSDRATAHAVEESFARAVMTAPVDAVQHRDLGTSCTLGESGGSGGSTSGGGGGADAFVCSCGDVFEKRRALRAHQGATKHPHAAAGSLPMEAAPSEVCEYCDEDAAEDAALAKTERACDGIAEAFLDECTELRFEQYISPANIQRIKQADKRMTAQKTAAVKRAIQPHVGADVNLDLLIDPIMKASDRYSTAKREARGRKNRQPYRVIPVKRSLGTHAVEYDVGDGKMETRQEELFVYDIPLEQSLQRELLYNPEFAQYMTDWSTRPPNADGTYTSTQDGSAAQNHPMLGNTTYQGAARLGYAHYYDDVEVVNPIGAARTTHKLGLHYIQLLNPPPHVRSDLDMIFLVSVVLKTTQDIVGIADVVQGRRNEAHGGSSLGASLRRFHDESGIVFDLPDGGGQRTFRGWLLLVAADALAAVELIGFKKSFSPNVKKICWSCDAPGKRDGLRCAASFEGQGDCTFCLRTSKGYRDQRRKAKAMPATERAQFEESIGVRTWQHAYTRIPYFDVMMHVPKDLMHVELEGNLKVHLYGLLYMSIKKYKWFTRSQLNARIASFPFLSAVRRPPPIPATTLRGRRGTLPRGAGSIPYTSGQMLHFVLHSLEILRPLLPSSAFESAEYKAWAAHVRYFAALMKSSFTDTSIAELDRLIYCAQTMFLKIAAYSALWKPKNHFAQHFPQDIRRFGPPRTFWCMRFEAKNQEHKCAAKTGNFKNTPGTVATFWAERSAFRLSKKRKRTEEVSNGALRYEGIELHAGMWVRIHRSGPYKERLAQISSVVYAENGTPQGLHVEAWDIASILRDDGEGGLCVPEIALAHGESAVVLLKSVRLAELLPVRHQGCVRFVDQP
jgi:hypothetical protein